MLSLSTERNRGMAVRLAVTAKERQRQIAQISYVHSIVHEATNIHKGTIKATFSFTRFCGSYVF